MDNLRAAILRPQIAQLDTQCERWNSRYHAVEQRLRECPGIHLPERPAEETFVGSSIQFSLPRFSRAQIADVVGRCAARGVVVKWFGDDEPSGYTSRYDSWRYIEEMPHLQRTERILATLLDMRIPLTFDEADCALIADIICEVVTECAQ